MTRSITFIVNDDFVFNDTWNTLDPDVVGRAIKHGFDAISISSHNVDRDMLHDQLLFDKKLANIVCAHSEEIKLLQEQHSESMRNLRMKLKQEEENDTHMLRTKLAESQLEITSLRTQLTEINKNHSTELISHINSLSAQMNSSTRMAIDALADKYLKVDSLTKSKGDDIKKLANVIESKVERALDEFTETLEPFRRFHARDISNTERGNLGEQWIAELISTQYPHAIINDTSRMGSSCDLHVTINENVFCVEVKNAGVVPINQVNTFINTVKGLRNKVHAGIMVSIRCPIQGKGAIRIEIIDNIPMAFVQIVNDEALYPVIEILGAYIKLSNELREVRESKDKNQEELIHDVRVLLDNHLGILVSMINNCNANKTLLRDIQMRVLEEEQSIQTMIRSIKIMIGKHSIIKPNTDVNEILINSVNTSRFTAEDIQRCMGYKGNKLDMKTANALLGQTTNTYIKNKGGLAELQSAIKAARKLKNDNVSLEDPESDKESDIEENTMFTDKELNKLMAVGGRLTYDIVKKKLKCDKAYIVARGGIKALNALLSKKKKKTKQLVDNLLDDSSDNEDIASEDENIA
jgi:hypothetical protein